MLIRPTGWRTLALFLLSVTIARAHDALQSSTNIWLRPDQMEVELILSRVPARSLVDNPPPMPVTDADFESTYHELFQKSAPTLVEVTLDGKKIEPASITVELYEETDLRFDYLFPRPPNGKLSFTAAFIKRMDEGYINSLGVNEGLHMIGMDDQNTDRPTWDMDLAPSAGTAEATADAKPSTNIAQAKAPINPHNFFFKAALICAIILLASLIARWRKRNGPPPP